MTVITSVAISCSCSITCLTKRSEGRFIWMKRRDKIQVIEGGNEQTKDNTDLPQRVIGPTLLTTNCSADNLPQPAPSIDFELLPAN